MWHWQNDFAFGSTQDTQLSNLEMSLLACVSAKKGYCEI